MLSIFLAAYFTGCKDRDFQQGPGQASKGKGRQSDDVVVTGNHSQASKTHDKGDDGDGDGDNNSEDDIPKPDCSADLPPDPLALKTNPFELIAEVKKKAPNIDVNGGEPFRRATGVSGGGNRWNSEGTLDMKTLNKVCDLLGYKKYDSSTCLDGERSGRYPNGKCNFHSPHNNTVTYYDGEKFVRRPAPSKYSVSWIANITCSEAKEVECITDSDDNAGPDTSDDDDDDNDEGGKTDDGETPGQHKKGE